MHKFKLASLVCITLVVIVSVLDVQATVFDFDTIALSDEEKNTAIEKVDLETVSVDNRSTGIICFDVHHNGMYALAFRSGSTCRVYVYEHSGEFLYGFKFYSDGDFAIELHENSLAIYFLRGNTIAIYNSLGVCTDIKKISLSSQQDHIRIKEMLNRSVKEVGKNKYALERDIELGNSYSRFVVENEYGKKTVLYDISCEHSLLQIIILAAIIAFFIFIISGIYVKHCRNKKTEDGSLS